MASVKRRRPGTCQSCVFPSWEQDVEFKGRLAVARESPGVEWTTWDGELNQEGGDGWRFKNKVLSIRNQHVNITCKALEPSAAQARLDLNVEQLKWSLLGVHFTLHGFQSGVAISMALADISLDQIMGHVGWKSSKTALHYIKFKQVLNTAGPAAKLSTLRAHSGKEYKLANGLKVFSKTFPE